MLVHHDDRGYEAAASEAATEARAKMEALIESGRQSAKRVFERVNEHVPVDRMARGKGLRFGYASEAALRPALEAKPLGDPALEGVLNDEGIPVQVAAILDQAPAAKPAEQEEQGSSRLVLEIAEASREPIHAHALAQIAGKAGIPSKYLRELAESSNPILQSLALEILDAHYRGTGNAADRYLLRSVDGELRGFLSDRYRRLDNRPLLEAFALGCGEVGAVPVDGVVSDVRVQMKAYLPMVFEPTPNEVMLIGLSWTNSDFGAAAYTLALTVLRLWCTNKAVMANNLRNVHLGRKLDDGIAYSQRTYELDTAATVSATRDAVRDLLSPARVNALQGAVREAAGQKTDWHRLPKKVLEAMSKSEVELGKQMFDGRQDDIIALPAERSVWRASNVLSWIAGRAEDADHRMDLERAAGELLDRFVPKAA